jgi:hypothetical protein
LDSQKGALKIDGQLDEVAYRRPFFKEYSLAVTGHPSHYTYGWVWNDDQYLYVAMDFTSDNTWDGDKDFAKVYINTESGVKEFKVSVPDTRWGEPGFTYTNKVGYQHKIYEFKIPFTEISKEGGYGQELLLAFSAYGTSGTTSGACCYGDGKSECTIINPAFCSTNLQGDYLGNGSSCNPCQPGLYIYRALIDSIPGEGGEVYVIQKGVVTPQRKEGIDYIVEILFPGSSGLLGPTSIYQYQGAGPGFVNINSDASTHPIGYDNGYDGASVVEFRALKSLLGTPDTMTIIYHASRGAFNDYTDPFQDPLGIPSFSQWGMIIFSLLLVISAILILRKRKTATAKLFSSALIVLGISGFAWACVMIICLDGDVADWDVLGINPSVIDAQGDSSADDSFEDIFAGYITSDDNYYYFRMDVDVYDLSICGDGVCNPPEDAISCYSDCGGCGDALCTSPPEDAISCYIDCGACGDGFCTAPPETPVTCPDDCGYCGDAFCTPPETPVTCPDDCEAE